jgi:hypothetical protein
MRRLFLLMLIGLTASISALGQFGGRDGDAVLYVVTAKGAPEFQVVPTGTANTATGFEIINPRTRPLQPFGPDFPGEFFVTLHSEASDNFRFIVQKEDIITQHNQFLGPAKLLIVEGIDRLLIPGKEPINLTAGLFAPFPSGVDFGPEIPILEASSFMWTPSAFFPLIQPRDPSFISPITPPGLTGSEYVLELGQFMGLIPWVGRNKLYPGAGWQQGIDQRLVERDLALGSSVRLIRLRPGRRTPTFRIAANTHIAVLSGSVQIAASRGASTVLNKFHYAFVPNNFAITISNPRTFSFAD